MDSQTITETHKAAAPLHRTLCLVVEVISWPFLLAARLLIVGNDVHRDEALLDLEKNGNEARYVLYSNHQSKLDPFLITASFASKTIWQLLPFRFFVLNSYLKGSMKAFIYAMGGFPAQYEEKKLYGLDCARAILKSKQTIVIFPQAKRTRERIAKRGISELATGSNVYLIPVHLDWKHRWHCQIHIGAPIKGGTKQSPEQLMEIVYSLPGVISK